jgi:hopene-associated glycosyltransferase HpnB
MTWTIASEIIAGCAVLTWAYLLVGRGGFWLNTTRDDAGPQPAEPSAWPSVAIVVPARDEADVIARSIGSLVNQDYPGRFRVILVDDQSSDGTAAVARAAAAGREGALEIMTGAPLPTGWTGKLWALSQGVARASADSPAYVLLTDADIAHAPDNLRRLVARAGAGGLALTSLMAKLNCTTPPERLMIPAFIFFFEKLFPFSWVSEPKSPVAAGAGGCMLVRRTALEAAGGIAAIRRAIIDDCALAAILKKQGPIWLGLTERAVSLRPYVTLAQIGRMIARSAYAQLNYNAFMLAGAALGMALTYLAPPALTLFARGPAQIGGAVAWVGMMIAFQPTLAFYRRSPPWALALPVTAALYLWFTLQSAVDFWRGRGGMWKGRAQAMAGPG